MKCLFIGICQTEAIYKILSENDEFRRIYEEIYSYTIFKVTEDEMKDILENLVPECDLIISQPVSEGYRDNNIFSTRRLREKVKKGGRHLVLANCYFTGYDPMPFQITDKNGNIIHIDNISYYPAVSFEKLLEGDIIGACKNWCYMEEFKMYELENNYRKTITELKEREMKIFDNDYGVDIKISDYIEENYRKKHLFHTYNHPTNELLYELTRRIMERIGMKGYKINMMEKELLGDTSIPPHISVYINMNMEFKYPKFIINNREFTTYEAMRLFRETLEKSDKNLHQQWKDCIGYKRHLIK